MNQMILNHALIMAAGRGNRMRPLTDSLPKPLVAFNGDTLIGNSLQMLKNVIPHVHVTVGYKKAMLAEYLMTRGGVDSIINTEGCGNAWWIQNTLMQFVDEPILVLTTDNITELDIQFLVNEYVRLGNPPCMLVPVIPIDGIEGDYIEHEHGVVCSLQRRVPQESYCSGIQVLNPKQVVTLVRQKFEDFYNVWNALISQQKLMTSQVYPKAWFTIDTLEQLAKASL
ncbi:MAG TPA: sugar phosphate nucleotidyltransferase [Bacteroidales bacterium]|nr:sugar phosphate nucleotidyltransferase [Bacteroidales bacterium]